MSILIHESHTGTQICLCKCIHPKMLHRENVNHTFKKPHVKETPPRGTR